MIDITKKWTGRRQGWSQIRAQLEIYFEERLCDRDCKRYILRIFKLCL